MFESRPGAKVKGAGIEIENDLVITYKQLQKDVRSCVDIIHRGTLLKDTTVAQPEKYIVRDENLPILLDRMRQSGKKLFLATNSGFAYTEKVMNFLFDVPSAQGRNWKDYFDVSIVDSRKPTFFEEGTLLRQVDTESGTLKLGKHMGTLSRGQVYSGGCYSDVTELIGCYGKEIMYIGDHIFGDILKSKKALGWRTFLVVPELADEIHVWEDKSDSIKILADLDDKIGELFASLDSSSQAADIPDITQLQKTLRYVVHDMDMAYGKFGSLFRTGSRNTMFAGQVMRFADLYASSFINLLHYPFSFLFRAEAQLLPHEQSITQEASQNQNLAEISEGSTSQTNVHAGYNFKETVRSGNSNPTTPRNKVPSGNPAEDKNVPASTEADTISALPNFNKAGGAHDDLTGDSPMNTRSNEPDFWKRRTGTDHHESNIKSVLDSQNAAMQAAATKGECVSTLQHQNSTGYPTGLRMSSSLHEGMNQMAINDNASDRGSRPATPTYLTHDFDDDESSEEDDVNAERDINRRRRVDSEVERILQDSTHVKDGGK